MNPWVMISVGWMAASLLMAGLWLVQVRTGDAGIVDVGWAAGVGALSVFFAAGSSDGDVARRVLVASLAMVWALRLGSYLLDRLLTMPEDGRYRALKTDWAVATQRRLFRFFQVQAAASVVFALPMLLAARATSSLGLFDVLGVSVWIVAIVGQTLSDRQLARFRRDPANRGKVCRDGFWKFSRHPNYFFEWLHWWAYVCLAITAPWGWLTLIGPLAMLYFLVFVTGIPPAEAQALRTRGNAYRDYQQTTSAFFPWPPKSNP